LHWRLRQGDQHEAVSVHDRINCYFIYYTLSPFELGGKHNPVAEWILSPNPRTRPAIADIPQPFAYIQIRFDCIDLAACSGSIGLTDRWKPCIMSDSFHLCRKLRRN
jgi:hypothetical protein